MNEVNVSLETVRMFKRIMRPVAEEGIISLPEYNEAISQLTSLAEHGTLKPVIVPKLIDQRSAADSNTASLFDSTIKKLPEWCSSIHLHFSAFFDSVWKIAGSDQSETREG